jgi:hypothetical protein
VITLVVLTIVVGTTIWVGIDHGKTKELYGDESIRSDAQGWVVGCLLLWIVFFPWYLVCRDRQRQLGPVAAQHTLTVGMDRPPPRSPANVPDLSYGSGWWEASDGRWYPPVDRRPPPPAIYDPSDVADTTPAGAWLAIAGGAMIAIGSLLPWVQIGGFARNGFQLGANESVTIDGPICLILGIVTIVIGITRLTNSAMPRFIQRSTIVTGVVVGFVLAGDYSAIHHSVDQTNGSWDIASIGYGYWVCGVGALVAVAGGIVLRSGQPGLSGSRMWLVLILVLGVAAVLLGLDVSSAPTTTAPAPAPITTAPAPAPAPTTTPPAPAGPTLTQQQQSARQKANQYLSVKAFSQQGLIDQLDSSAGSGYSVNDATVAVDSLTVDWNAEAVKAAKEYLAMQPFSCSGLIQQLDSSAGGQFTVAQATYGAQQAEDC